MDEYLKSWWTAYYARQVILLNKKKQSDEINDKYLKKQIEVGDIVHKVKDKTIKRFHNREGKVIQVIDNRSKILWDKRTSTEYEFNSNLKIVRMGKKENYNLKQYCILIIGKQYQTPVFDNYEDAEKEAKRIVCKEHLPAYVLKSVAIIEPGLPIITKIDNK